jgi:hypothetical protein
MTDRIKVISVGFKELKNKKQFNTLLKSANQDLKNQLWKSAKENLKIYEKIKPDDKL